MLFFIFLCYTFSMEKKKTLTYREYLHKEYNISHAPFLPEMEFYNAIGSGQLKKVETLCEEPFAKKKGFGILSNDHMQSMKYHFVITAAQIARSCIANGLNPSEAYNMSDYYIQRADQCHELDTLSLLHYDMCIAYTKAMQTVHKSSIASLPIRKCIDYIYDNLHTRITVDTLSAVSGITNAYLSRLFKKETGYTISDYILSKKLETAKSMLAYSDYSIADISSSLAFPSQSYFTNALKKDCGLSPLQYRHSRSV